MPCGEDALQGVALQGGFSVSHGLQEDAHDFLRQWLDKAHDVHEGLLKAQQPEGKVHIDISHKALLTKSRQCLVIALHNILLPDRLESSTASD